MEIVECDGVCGVCRQTLKSASIRHCDKCGTPYHVDCWRYNDNRCAVYACMPLRGLLRVRRGRGLSRGDTVILFLGLATLLVVFVYGWIEFVR